MIFCHFCLAWTRDLSQRLSALCGYLTFDLHLQDLRITNCCWDTLGFIRSPRLEKALRLEILLYSFCMRQFYLITWLEPPAASVIIKGQDEPLPGVLLGSHQTILILNLSLYLEMEQNRLISKPTKYPQVATSMLLHSSRSFTGCYVRNTFGFCVPT